jgi:hypothetical protein
LERAWRSTAFAVIAAAAPALRVILASFNRVAGSGYLLNRSLTLGGYPFAGAARGSNSASFKSEAMALSDSAPRSEASLSFQPRPKRVGRCGAVTAAQAWFQALAT